MSRVALNKSSLNKQKRGLKTFNRYLPALELKQQQLMIERRKAYLEINKTEKEIEQLLNVIKEQLPMLSLEVVNLDNLVEAKTVKLGIENIVGTQVPVIEDIHIIVKPYSEFIMPHWVDRYVDLQKKMICLLLEKQVRQMRYERLNKATKITSQRVNLFSKVLIPKTRHSIKKIQIYLSDQDRAGVLNAKLSKGKIVQQQ